MLAAVLALLAGGAALQLATRLRGEETSGRAEPLLAGAVPRWRWAASHLVVAAGSTAVRAAAGLGLGLAHAGLTSDAGQVPRLLGATLVHAPALWVLVGVVALLAGLLPAAAVAAVLVVVGLAGLRARDVG